MWFLYRHFSTWRLIRSYWRGKRPHVGCWERIAWVAWVCRWVCVGGRVRQCLILTALSLMTTLMRMRRDKTISVIVTLNNELNCCLSIQLGFSQTEHAQWDFFCLVKQNQSIFSLWELRFYDFILKVLIYTDMFQKLISRCDLKKIFFFLNLWVDFWY